MFADYFDSNFGKVRRKHSTLKYLIDLVQGFKMQMTTGFQQRGLAKSLNVQIFDCVRTEDTVLGIY